MCERLKQAVLKTAVPARVPGVRIPLPPPVFPEQLAARGPSTSLRISPAGSDARKAAQVRIPLPLPGSPTPGRCRGPVNLQFHTFRGSEALFQGMNGISIAQKSRGGNVKISANPPFKDQNRVKRNNLPVGHRIATLPPRNAIVGRLHVSSRPPAERSGPRNMDKLSAKN
jgi:hypothetical protein